MNIAGYPVGFGRLLALLVLLIAILFAIVGKAPTDHWIEGGFAALALALLLP